MEATGRGARCIFDKGTMLSHRHLPLIATFVQVCREGSFTKAARSLSLSKGQVSNHLRTLEEALGARLLERTTRRVYRMLELDGYARVDYRLTPGGELYLLEANPNPEIAEKEEFASAALAAGISYRQLLQRIVSLAQARPVRPE